MKKVVILLVVVAFLFCVAGCSNTPADTTAATEDTEATADAAATDAAAEPEASGGEPGASGDRPILTDDEIHIGICVMDMGNPYMTNTIEGVEAFAEEFGYPITVTSGESSAEKQVSAIESMMSAGVNVMDVRIVDPQAVTDILTEAVGSGAYMMTYPEVAGVSDAFLSYDDYDSGHLLGEVASNWVEETYGADAEIEIALLTQPTVDSVIKRADGMRDAVTERLPNATIVAETEGATTDVAMSAAESILQKNPDCKVFLCVNDAGGLGAYEAVKGSGKDVDGMFIGGVDGDASALEFIKEGGPYRCTIANDLLVQELGYYLIRNVVRAAKGEDYEYDVTTQLLAVTSDNIEEYMTRTVDYSRL